MTPSARVQAAIDILDLIIVAARDGGASADKVAGDWLKARRFVGSKDRRAIRDLVWRTVRAYGNAPVSGRAAVLGLGDAEIEVLFDGGPHAPAPVVGGEARAQRHALPDWLEPPDWLDEVEAAALLERAPLDIRVNPLRAGVDDIKAAFPDALPIAGLPNAMRLSETPDIARHPLFLSGAFEVQDAGSQHVTRIAAARPGETVIDLCAGGGGKTLALAADMGGGGRLIACDTSRARLSPLMPRAERAGVGFVETRLLDPGREPAALEDLQGQADLVLVDAPCSGSGTWRRSPDLRWRLTRDRLARIVDQQAHILGVARELVRPGGRLVYAVCSFIDAEGAEHMQALDGGFVPEARSDVGRARGSGQVLTPFHDGTDGFFIASLRRSC